jgi:plastocyanin
VNAGPESEQIIFLEMKAMKLSTRSTFAASAVALLLAGCSSSGPTYNSQPPGTQAPSGTSNQATAATIVIKDFNFQASSPVASGTNVTVTNMDSQTHTVTADDGSSFDVTVKGTGGTATFKAPAKAGTYKYHCNFHSSMHGTLIVQ